MDLGRGSMGTAVDVRFGSRVAGALARTFFTFAALVGAAFVRPVRAAHARQLVQAPIIYACTRRWLWCLGWRIWSHRSRRSHTPTKPRLHRRHSERCPYR